MQEQEKDPFLAELENAVTKDWILNYDNNEIIIKNSAMKEEIYINGKCVAQSERTGALGMYKPFQRLKATFENSNGTTSSIAVKFGGFITLKLKVKIDGKVIFKDKINIFK